MTTLLKSGIYKLFETRRHKMLYLDGAGFAWLGSGIHAEILPLAYKPHKTDYLLAAGRYKLYEVHDEPGLSDQVHLELEAGPGQWQGYLMLAGLPSGHRRRGRIIPTTEKVNKAVKEASYVGHS